MSINLSYAISVMTEKIVGTTPSDRNEDRIDSLRQAIQNTVLDGRAIKLDINLPLTQSRTIDISQLGVSNPRCILIKSDRQFGYSIDDNVWFLSKTLFIDFNDIVNPLSLTTSKTYSLPNIIRLENPLINPTAYIQLIAVGT